MNFHFNFLIGMEAFLKAVGVTVRTTPTAVPLSSLLLSKVNRGIGLVVKDMVSGKVIQISRVVADSQGQLGIFGFEGDKNNKNERELSIPETVGGRWSLNFDKKKDDI